MAGPATSPAASAAAGLVILAVAVVMWNGPDRLARIFWGGLIPLVPLALLINPAIWRNICPLSLASTGPLSRPGLTAAPRIGLAILLFMAILPVRAVLLGGSARASSVALVVLLVVAVVAGRRRPHRSGFCTAWCPMLPVELLYGQAPLTTVRNRRCDSCSTCTPRACPDLSVSAAIAQHLGGTRRAGGWTRTPFGAFAAAFPGVIYAFFQLGPGPGAGQAVAGLGAGALISWLVVSVLMRAFQPAWQTALRVLGGVSAALWIWFAVPAAIAVLIPALDSTALQVGTRLMGGGMVAWWIAQPGRNPRGENRVRSTP